MIKRFLQVIYQEASLNFCRHFSVIKLLLSFKKVSLKLIIHQNICDTFSMLLWHKIMIGTLLTYLKSYTIYNCLRKDMILTLLPGGHVTAKYLKSLPNICDPRKWSSKGKKWLANFLLFGMIVHKITWRIHSHVIRKLTWIGFMYGLSTLQF